MTEDEHPNERLVTPSEDGEGFDRSLVSRRSMLGGSALLAGLLAYTSDPTDPQLPGRASGSAAGIARASDNPDEPLIILGPESDPVGYLFQDTAGGIILQDATSGNHFWYNESQGRWETDAELDVPTLTTDALGVVSRATLQEASETISGGSIPYSAPTIEVSPESGSTDDLSDITGSPPNGTIVIIHPSSGDTITLKHNTGSNGSKFFLKGGSDKTLDDPNITNTWLQYRNQLAWVQINDI